MKVKVGKVRRINAFDVLLAIFFILFTFLMIYPVYYVLIGSFNEGLDYLKGGVYFWPRKLTFDNYIYVFAYKPLWRGFLITILRTLLASFLHVVITAGVAYAMGRKELRFKNFYYWFSIVTMFFGGGIVPFFLLLKILGLYNTFWVYIIPAVYSVYDMLIICTFMKEIPREMIDSAELDGAGEYRILISIMFPMSMPILATISLWAIVGHWNDYISTMYYAPKEELWTLQYVLKQMINSTSVSAGGPITEEMLEKISSATVSYAAIVIATIPVLLVYPLLSKNFEGGFMVGSLKG